MSCIVLTVSPCTVQATLSGHLIVVYEVSLSIARLVRKYGHGLSLIEWDHVIGILMVVSDHIEVSGALFRISLHFKFILQAKRDNLPPDNMLVGSFSDTIATIENYHHTSEFNGSLEMFFALVEKCLPYRPVRGCCC